MSSKHQIFIPQTVSWLLRLAAHPQLSDNLSRDAVAFAALDTQLSPQEWLDQLQIECEIKNAPRRGRGRPQLD